MNRFSVIIFLTFWLAAGISAQQIDNTSVTKTQILLHWYADQELHPLNFTFDGAVLKLIKSNSLPVYEHSFPVKFTEFEINFKLKDKIFEEIPFSAELANQFGLDENITIIHKNWYDNTSTIVGIEILPLRKNKLTGNIEKLLSAELITETKSTNNQNANIKIKETFRDNSPLSSGSWHRFKISGSGIYKISHAQLSEAGINLGNVKSDHIQLFGNGGGMLPEANYESRYDGLQENAILIQDGGDGSFDNGDYIVFYGKGPNTWQYDPVEKIFRHTLHLYDNYSYYFLNLNGDIGKRINTINSLNETADISLSSYDDYLFFEEELYNLIISGRQWFGEQFNVNTEQTYDYSIPDLLTSEPLVISSNVCARSLTSSKFTYSINGKSILSQTVSNITNVLNSVHARTTYSKNSFSLGSSAFTLKLEYNRPLSSSIGWLDYFELNYKRNLNWRGSTLLFRNGTSYVKNQIQEFKISNFQSGLRVWDVQDPINAKQISTVTSSGQTYFRYKADTIREFALFSDNNLPKPQFDKTISNQNLHALKDIHYIILVYPEFRSAAEELAAIHRAERPELNIEIVEPQQIYNEFSSGAQDITAIRDFVRQLSLKSDEELLYLLLLGDASYDYKDILSENSNYVPTWQSPESLHPVHSFATDDYFGLFDASEGYHAEGVIDLGIGRFPVQSIEQAKNAVNKVRTYYSKNDETLNSWRNVICFVADDEDNNSHIRQANDLATYIDTNYRQFNVDKIYLDAYEQISTPGGQRYPEATEAINNRIARGALIMNYTGHGGELGWAHERVLENSDISSWTNLTHMPLFITATCEFSRYDDPDRAASGELIFLSETGGGIALYTTSRQTYGSSNTALNQAIFNNMFVKTNGQYGALGDILKKGKKEYGGNDNGKKFVLLGDPALKLAFPENKVQITEMNNKVISETPDTISALSLVQIKGEVCDPSGNRLSGFNGKVFPLVYDKAAQVSTLGQDPKSTPFSFSLYKNAIFKGEMKVEDGKFDFSFIVPRDIVYSYGFGKISFYACDDTQDANGYYENFVVGGFSDDPPVDNAPPEIELFINNEDFIPGSITSENPLLLAYVRDENGINTVGNGIGHDISVVLDDNTQNIKIINDYYQADLNTFKTGSIMYPMHDLSEGYHSLKLTVWDVMNNSASAETNFVVVRSSSIRIENLLNGPNPAHSKTRFIFEHNQAGNEIQMRLEVFDITGRLVYDATEQIIPEGFRTFSNEWNLRANSGEKLKQGIYIYRLSLIDQNGNLDTKTSKLIIDG